MPSTAATKIILNTLHFSGLAKMCGTIMGQVGSILMLHRVTPSKSEFSNFSPNAHLSITPEFLDKLLEELSKSGFEFVDLDEAKRRIISKDKSQKFIAITLDDGYKDNQIFAAPIFEKHEAPYTIFVAPGLVDGRATLWWEDLEAIISNNDEVSFDFADGAVNFSTQSTEEKQIAFDQLMARLTSEVSEQEQRQIMDEACNKHGWNARAHQAASIMSWDEIKTISATKLCNIGAHTLHHYAVARLSEGQCEAELKQSASEIETKLGSWPTHFAYPYGYPAAAAKRDFDIAKQCGFQTAVTTRHGVCFNAHSAHLTGLPRISVNGLFQDTKYVKTLLSGAPTLIQNKGKNLTFLEVN